MRAFFIQFFFWMMFPNIFASSAFSAEMNSLQYYEHGVDLAKNSQYKEALAAFTKAIELDPKSVKAYCARSEVEFPYNSDYKGALNDLTQAIKLDPNLVSTYFLRANFRHTFLSDTEGAIADLSKVIEIDPKNARAYMMRAEIETNGVDENAALSDLAMAIKFDPKDAYWRRGLIRVNASDAIADFTKAIELDPKNEELYEDRAERKLPDDPAGAIADYSQAIKVSRQSNNQHLGWLYDSRAAIKQYMGDFRGAINDYTSAIEAGDYSMMKWDDEIPYYHRGVVKELTGDLQGALEDFQRFANSHILPYGHGDDSGFHDEVQIDIWVLLCKLGRRTDANKRLYDYSEKRQKKEFPYDHCAPQYDPGNTGISNYFDFLLGTMDEAAFLNNVHEEGYYYVGMKHLLAGDKKRAIKYLQQEVALPNSACPDNDRNREFAEVELKTLEK